MIPYGRQSIGAADLDAVKGVLESDFLTQGSAIPRFEQALAKTVGAAFGIAVCNGTAALHLACMALDIGPGDRVWTSPLTFVASANCALYCGASIDFVDIDLTTGNLSVECLRQRLASSSSAGTLPKAIVLVHYAGRPAGRAEIAALAQQYGVALIEDAAHALGAEDELGPIGNGEGSSATTFSFHPVKIITTGEGGMVMTNNSALAERMRRLRAHGVERELASLDYEGGGDWYYEQQELGFNYRMTDIQAALGISQLDRLSGFIARRREIALRYIERLNGLPIGLPTDMSDAEGRHAWHLFVIQVADRARVFAGMRQAGIGVQVHYLPVHLHPYYRKRFAFDEGDFPAAEAFYQKAISLPIYPDLTEDEQNYVVQTLEQLI